MSVDYAPLATLLLMASVLAAGVLAFVWLRRASNAEASRAATLTAVLVFLTFDLIVVGAFTRLSDSGLGCPDWPGCYGHASPLGAAAHIDAAEAQLPDGPVTHRKAWIEMVHRYLAMTVGALTVTLAVVSWIDRRRIAVAPWWPIATALWVVVQGLFGRYTVTLKLYPAIVTLHLLGGVALLALLVVQREAYVARALALVPAVRRVAWAALAALVVQIALGGWVSTNYAVLACRGFPACNERWWPSMDFAAGFEILRHLGRTGGGELLSFDALVAIHMTHRLFAIVAAAAIGVLAWRLSGSGESSRRFGRLLGALLVLQLASGLSNVVLDWPLVAALAHSAGAAALVAVLVVVVVRSGGGVRRERARGSEALRTGSGAPAA